jgi:hypothetical protein
MIVTTCTEQKKRGYSSGSGGRSLRNIELGGGFGV